jgi:putative membrane protein
MVALTPADHDALRAAIAKAEQGTSAELVLAVNGASSEYEVYRLAGAVLAAACAAGAIALDWPMMHVRVAFIIVVAVAFAVYVLLQIDALLLMLVPEKVRRQACEAASRAYFMDSVMGRTQAGNGLLIFVSLAERYVAVLPDTGIARVISQPAWAQVIHKVVQAVQGGTVRAGLLTAVEDCLSLLAEKFPPGAQNPNEIADDVVGR